MDKKIDHQQVKKVTHLARLDLTEEQIDQFSTQLSAILEYVEKMDQLDTTGVEPLAHCLHLSNCFRQDIVKESLGTEITLANAPDTDGDFFKVPKILEDNSGA